MQHNIKLLSYVTKLMNAIIVSLLLIGFVWIYIRSFDQGYFALLVTTFLLVYIFVDSVDFESNNKVFWKKTVLGLVLQWFLVISLLMVMGFASTVTPYYSRILLFLWFFSTPFMLIMMHCFLRFMLNKWTFSEDAKSKAIILGINESSRKLADEFTKKPLLGMVCTGFFDDRLQERVIDNTQYNPVTFLGTIASAAEFVKNNYIKYIFIALPMAAQPRILDLLDELRDTTGSIYFLPDMVLFDLLQTNPLNINGIPIIAVCESPFVGFNGIIKRIMDVVLSVLILLLIAPFMFLIAVGIKLSSPGSVLFKQHRYGLDGKEIVVYKFRSMTVVEDGDHITQATRCDPRITKFGRFLRKTSLDELPQFINVLQGRMSIVGPRPHAISHNEIYRKLVKGYMVRHKVKPGITGWAQIKGFRGETDNIQKMQSRVFYDLDYLQNWSIFFDFFIIFKTIGVVIKDNNAY